MENLKQLLWGAVIGIANLIPGVSGGTFALVLGVYDRLLQAVKAWNFNYLKKLSGLAWRLQFKLLAKELLTSDNLFLARLGLGAVLAIVLVSKLLSYLLLYHYQPTYGFFFGLILLSIYLPLKMCPKHRGRFLVWLLLGLALTLLVSVMVDPSLKVLQKSAQYQLQLSGAVSPGSLVSFTEYGQLFLVGALAISAMVLPGISGSFILLLFGRYAQIIGAISRLELFSGSDYCVLFSFGFGVVVGALLFVRLLCYLLRVWQAQTLYCLAGLMLGSLYALWPFKVYRIADVYSKLDGEIVLWQNKALVTNKLALPSDIGQLGPVLLSCLAGVVIMALFIAYENRNSR